MVESCRGAVDAGHLQGLASFIRARVAFACSGIWLRLFGRGHVRIVRLHKSGYPAGADERRDREGLGRGTSWLDYGWPV
jgi:hypothetical protein